MVFHRCAWNMQREIVPCSASANSKGAIHCKKSDIISTLHIPLHASGDVLQTCINDSNATCGVRHSNRVGARRERRLASASERCSD